MHFAPLLRFFSRASDVEAVSSSLQLLMSRVEAYVKPLSLAVSGSAGRLEVMPLVMAFGEMASGLTNNGSSEKARFSVSLET
jgi:hypothetical protein